VEVTLLDTNILIEILKGNQRTITELNMLNSSYAVSIISYMELIYGAFNSAEVKKIEKFLSNFEVIDVNKEVSQRALELIKKYAKSHTLDIPDALIAATAIVKSYNLFTYNKKDFKYIKSLQLL